MGTETLFDRVLAHFDKSPTKLAEALCETVPTVCNWRSRGIPAHKAMAVSRLTAIPVKELRPDDWQLYWPDPVQKKRAKPAPEAA